MTVLPKLEFKFAAFSWVHDGDHGEVREGRGDILGGRRWAQFRPLTSTSCTVLSVFSISTIFIFVVKSNRFARDAAWLALRCTAAGGGRTKRNNKLVCLLKQSNAMAFCHAKSF